MISEAEQQQACEHLLSVRDWLRWAETVLRREAVFLGHGTDHYWDEGLVLVMHALHLPWHSDPRILDARLLPAERQAVVDLLARRVNDRMPAAYLTGRAWFCGLEFLVDERVLIPRSPIAELIEQGFAPFIDPERVGRVLDLCTGSGCIAIACAYAFPEVRVDASDIDAGALAVCRENVALHGLQSRVFPREADAFTGLEGEYDLIVTNPPYVDAGDMAALPAEYRHEPALALASGADGLDFTRRLLVEAPDHLAPGGVLVAEVGNSGDALQATWPEVPFMWLEFEHGGEGVFSMTREALLDWRDHFRAGL